MFPYIYEIGQKEFRDSTDLTLYGQGITAGIKAIFGKEIEVKVGTNQFEFYLEEEALSWMLRMMGKSVIAHSPSLAPKVKTYLYTYKKDGSPGKSRQLFRRVKTD